jgi:hypothetical protein
MKDEAIQEFPCHLCDWVIRGDFASREVAEQVAALLGWRRILGRWYCTNCWEWPRGGWSS